MPKNTRSIIRMRRTVGALAFLVGGMALVGGDVPPVRADKSGKPDQRKDRDDRMRAGDDAGGRKYRTTVLWDFDGLLKDSPNPRSNRPRVHNGNAYLVVILPGRKVNVVKVPLDGGKVQMEPLWKSKPDYVAGEDNHRYYAVGIDSDGYIHVTGDMHQQPWVPHWISKKPEDISEFVRRCGEDDNKGPQGRSVTYPHFFRSPRGELYHSCRMSEPVWGMAVSRLDVKTQTWTMLGDDLSKEDAGKKAKRGRPVTVWEDNGIGHDHGYTQPHLDMCWDKNNRMHIAWSLLDRNLPGDGGICATHILYAYSDDGGKTVHRGDGTKIQWPMRAEKGPHQADVVLTEDQGPPRWLNVGVSISLDERDRPVIVCKSFRTGKHRLVLDDGKWVDRKEADSRPGAAVKKSDGAAAKKDDDPDDEREIPLHVRSLDLKHPVGHLDEEYLRDTGNLLYTAVVPEKERKKRIVLVHARPVPGGK